MSESDSPLGLWRARQRSTPWRRDYPASQRTREELTALIEGRLSTASAKDELVKLATRLIVEEALEGEAGDTLGRVTTSTVRSRARATATAIVPDG
jgi:hypothetical protein